MATTKRADEALMLLDKAIGLDPLNPESYFWKSSVMRISKNKNYEALKLINIAIDIDPVNARYILERAKILISNEQYKEGIIDLNRVLQLDPSDGDTYYLRGLTKFLSFSGGECLDYKIGCGLGNINCCNSFYESCK